MREAFWNCEQGNSVKRFLVKAKAISKVRHRYPSEKHMQATYNTELQEPSVCTLMWEWERTQITVPVAAGKNTPKTLKKDSPGL